MRKKTAIINDDHGHPMTQDCPGGEVFNHITRRWAILIFVALHAGPQRFHALRDGMAGVSEKMLAQTLKVLARDGFVLRQVEPTLPPQVSYALTPLGLELARQLRGLVHWLGHNIDTILAVQRVHDGGAQRQGVHD